jgi:hypothetical protein
MALVGVCRLEQLRRQAVVVCGGSGGWRRAGAWHERVAVAWGMGAGEGEVVLGR